MESLKLDDKQPRDALKLDESKSRPFLSRLLKQPVVLPEIPETQQPAYELL
jgi:hypothetical protein